jgi:hypothetical protein
MTSTLVVNDLGDGFLDILRRDAARFDVSGEAGVEALHGRVRLIAGHDFVDRRLSRPAEYNLPPSSRAAISSRVIDALIESITSLSSGQATVALAAA